MRSNLSRVFGVPAVFVGLFVLSLGVVTGCSDAQTPNAYYVEQVIPSDGGGVGQRDFPCRSDNSCATADLQCIQENPDSVCRLLCDPAVASSCEATYSCRRITGTDDGACIPTGPLGGVDDPCPCASGLRCIDFGASDGGTGDLRCRTECSFDDAGVAGDCPANEGRCRLLDNSTTVGACVE